MLLCLARESEEPGFIPLTSAEIAWRIRRPLEEVEATLSLCQQGDRPIITAIEGGYQVLKFLDRQYEKPSDQPAATRERKQKQRDKEKSHADVTPCHAIDIDTDTAIDTDTDLKDLSSPAGSVRTKKLTKNEMFNLFWLAYPKKKSKGQAEKAWAKIKLSEQLFNVIIDALRRATTSVEWTKEVGQYIPYPATWLNAKGWEDEYQDITDIQPRAPDKKPIPRAYSSIQNAVERMNQK
jgi:hypothetical protein